MTSENKRKTNPTQTGQSIPLPIQSAPTLIKIEDCSNSSANNNAGTITTMNHHSAYDPKAIQAATITTAVQTNDVSPDIAAQLSYYQTHGLHGNLIQISSHPPTVPSTVNSSVANAMTTASFINPTMECRTLPQISHHTSLQTQQQHTSHMMSPTTDVTISTMSCLTPISETCSRSEDNLDSSGISSIPEGKC